MNLKVFIIAGMPASDKNIARIYGEKGNIPYFATGDLVREEVKRRGMIANAENMARVSDELRGRDGMGVTRLALQTAQESGDPLVFLKGGRSWPEVELIREKADGVVVAFLAPRQIRLERIVSRGRPDDSADRFEARDRREIDYGAAIPIALADAYILNTGTMEEAMQGMDETVRKYEKQSA